jgi:prophage regulatory protein
LWSVLAKAWLAHVERRQLSEPQLAAVMDVVHELLQARDPRGLLIVDWQTEERRVADKLRRDTARATTVESVSKGVMLRPRDVAALVGLSLGSLYRLSRAGKFPKLVKLSERASAWRASDVEDWLALRASGKDWAT